MKKSKMKLNWWRLSRLRTTTTTASPVLMLLLLLMMMMCVVEASEFPERECCDPIYPMPDPTSRLPNVPSPTGKTGSDKTTAILNCLYARKLCFEHASCSAILEVIPRVCGPELVACSTVTVSKCQAALKSLQAFEFFKPTCLCHEPHVDPECNDFRDFLFDHKCIYVNKKEKDPYSIEALPTCNHALSECQRDKSCVKLYDDFKTNCKTRDGRCRMENRDACTEAWTQLRLSPMFGCICPDNGAKKRCDRIFSMVNHNPCVVNVISNSDNTTTLELIESQVQNPLIDADHQDLHALKQLPIPNVPHQHRIVTSSSSSHGHRSKNQSSSSSAQAAQQHNGGSSDDREDGLAAPSSLPDNNERLLLAQQQPAKVVLSSTCHHAYTACKNDPSCSNLLQPVLSRCDHSSCARNECLSALEHFYKAAAHKHSLEIAFCLCRKSEGKRDECMMAQEKLHPSCALRAPAGQEKPTCNALATSCRQRPSCRAKLEHYEQNCAVDSVTKKCAGPAQGCRTALLGILGTELRTACDCRGTDFAPIYECLGWQRLLWVNPCVAAAQKDFHARRSRHHGHGRSGTSTSGPATIAKTPRTTTTKTTTTTTQRATWPTVVTPRASLVAATSFESLPEEEVEVEEERRHEAEDNNVIPDVPTVRSIEESHRFNKESIAAESDAASATTSTTATTTPMSSTKAPTTTTTTTTTTPAPTTPSTTTTSTVPPRFCVYQRPSQSHQQYIREGKGKRFYKDSEPDECSELCQCGEGERLTCNVICVKSSPCKTDFAFYNHAAPAYQAYRGRCLCYSGRFICMRPSPDTYNIPHGVFMFLGYSETDENLLKPLNNLTVVDAVVSLDNFMREEVNNQTICTLFLYNITKENVIAAARLTNDNALQQANVSEEENLRHLMRVKEECATMLQELSEKINNRHQEVHSHPLLSIFKMAEVEIKLPRTSSGSASPVVDTSWWYSSMLGCAVALLLCTSTSASS
ncbi:uncharacterized protein LOC106656465 [Trichogramma pretiosum]|uniref:uncharacterized protein LOC106656465 n=1 Tax=Trichogramma pretiosum TaxID=7493 RepID=UPI000C71B451|nr:uncharacterized protein LOC106656465 [Trichogramma pretiosum]